MSRGNRFAFFSKRNGTSLIMFKQESNIIRFVFLKNIFLAATWKID